MTEQTTRPEKTASQRAGGLSLTALQCELRALFANRPTNRALAEVLQRVGTHLGAAYAVVHTRLGVHLLSEEWQRAGAGVDSETREQVNTTLWEAISAEEARCTRLEGRDRSVIVTAVMYDADVEPSGGAALVLHDCERSRVLQVMAQLEGVLGYLSLLIAGTGTGGNKRLAERRQIEPHGSADHPVRLACAIVSELETRYGFELSAVGFVRGHHVEVAAISGVDDLRPSNPGVGQLRAAMEECLDRGEPIVWLGHDASEEQDDCRLHAQWSSEAHGNPVASLPLAFLDETVAIVSMSQGAGTKLSREQVQIINEELSGYAALVPLSRAASRSLPAHCRDSLRDTWRRLCARGSRKNMVLTVLTVLFGIWLAFGELDYSFTVPCSVKATDRRTIACPRSGVLAELFVRPGDRVRQGQLLASLDASEDFLRRSELSAEIGSLDALIDHAIATRESGQKRVHEAKKRSLAAQLAIVDASIGQAQIRAPQDGLILEGDLRERLGGRIEMGQPLFELARYDRVSVVLRIPEKLVLAANDCRRAQFAPAAQPDQTWQLEGLRIAPASGVIDAQNVFLGEATLDANLGQMPPGMEGTTHVDAGPRPAFWVITHRVTDWLHMSFWL